MKEKNLKSSDKFSQENFDGLPFASSNFKIMILGIILIVAGFIIMTLDKEEFGFGFMGLTLGPITAFVGFMIEFYALLKKKA